MWVLNGDRNRYIAASLMSGVPASSWCSVLGAPLKGAALVGMFWFKKDSMEIA